MEEIRHQARIISIKGDVVELKITSQSACSSCLAKGVCGLSESKEKIIVIKDPKVSTLKIGEEVDIATSLTGGIKAVIYAYVIPLILLVATIIGLQFIGFDDFKSGISGIIVLIPYYFVLFLMRSKITSDIKFKIIRHKANG